MVAEQFCREHRALLIVDPPAAWETCDEALQGLRELAFRSDHALMCFPRIQAFDRLRGRLETFANSGADRGHVCAHGCASLALGRGRGRAGAAASGREAAALP